MGTSAWRLVLAAACAALATVGDAKVIKGTMYSQDCFKFMGRFSFEENSPSDVDFSIQTPQLLGNLKLVVYYDQFETWTEVHGTSTTCQEKFYMADCALDLGNTTSDADGVVKRAKGFNLFDGRMTCSAMAKKGWVFLALVNFDPVRCQTTTLCDGALMNITYELNLQNPSNAFAHFSSEESGVLGFVIMIFVYATLMLYPTYQMIQGLQRKRQMHHTVNLLVLSVACYYCCVTCLLIHYGRYQANGIGVDFFRVLGDFFMSLADITLLLLVILIAKGWTIVRRKISAQGRLKISVYLTLYVATKFAALIWYETSFNEASAISMYSTTPGMLVMILRFVAVLWFAYAVSTTMRNFHAKKRFYTKFSIGYGAWVLSPLFFYLVSQSMEEWSRTEFVLVTTHLMTAFALTCFVLLYTPASWNATFPFHASTNDMKGTSGAGNDSSSAEKDPLRAVKSTVMKMKKGINMLSEYSMELLMQLDAMDNSDRDVDLAPNAGRGRSGPSARSFGSADVDAARGRSAPRRAEEKLAGGETRGAAPPPPRR